MVMTLPKITGFRRKSLVGTVAVNVYNQRMKKKPAWLMISFRMPSDFAHHADKLAKLESLSRSAYVRKALEYYLQNRKKTVTKLEV